MRPIQFVPPGVNLRFIERRFWGYAISALLILTSVVSFAVQGLNFGIDFTGGTLIEVRTQGDADIAAMRGTLGGLGLGSVSLQEFGGPSDVLIRVQQQEGDEQAQVAAIDRKSTRLNPSH